MVCLYYAACHTECGMYYIPYSCTQNTSHFRAEHIAFYVSRRASKPRWHGCLLQGVSDRCRHLVPDRKSDRREATTQYVLSVDRVEDKDPHQYLKGDNSLHRCCGPLWFTLHVSLSLSLPLFLSLNMCI